MSSSIIESDELLVATVGAAVFIDGDESGTRIDDKRRILPFWMGVIEGELATVAICDVDMCV